MMVSRSSACSDRHSYDVPTLLVILSIRVSHCGARDVINLPSENLSIVSTQLLLNSISI